MEYHEHSYLVSLLFAAPFLLFIIFSKFFSTCYDIATDQLLYRVMGKDIDTPVRLERATRSEADTLEEECSKGQTGAGRESQADSTTGLHT